MFNPMLGKENTGDSDPSCTCQTVRCWGQLLIGYSPTNEGREDPQVGWVWPGDDGSRHREYNPFLIVTLHTARITTETEKE